MSVISTAYAAIVTRLDTIYASSSYKKLVNSREIELNDTLSLARGYGFTINAGINTKATMSNHIMFSRELVVVNSIVQRGTDRDTTIAETAEKLLLEDQFLAIQSFHGSSLVGPIDVEYISDEGIESVFIEQKNYLFIRSIYNLLYEEQC